MGAHGTIDVIRSTGSHARADGQSFAVAQHICAAVALRRFGWCGYREKVETFRTSASCQGLTSWRSELEMVDTVTLRAAVETTWSIFCATHDGVDVADSRRCLLERHLQGRCEAREEDVDELASFGLAYLARLPEDEC